MASTGTTVVKICYLPNVSTISPESLFFKKGNKGYKDGLIR